MAGIKHDLKKVFLAVVLGLSLLTSTMYVDVAHAQNDPPELKFIDIDLSNTANPNDFPFGIDCGTVEDRFVYVTIFSQGLLAEIDKVALPNGTHAVELIDDPDSDALGDPFFGREQTFYAIARDPNNGNLFINERDNGKAWRFNPSAPPETAWDRIPLVPEIVHPKVTYPLTYLVGPDAVRVDESTGGTIRFVTTQFDVTSVGGVVFANNFIWIGIKFRIDFDTFANSIGVNDMSFSGIVRVDPNTLNATRFEIPDSVLIASLNVDEVDPTKIWVADKIGKIYKFDTDPNVLQVVQTISSPLLAQANHVDTDDNNIFVALNERNPSEDEENPEPGIFSEIAQIDRTTSDISIINTTAPNTVFGTFTVFVNNDLLVWTDQSQHVGVIDLITGEKSVNATSDTNSNHFGCIPFDGEFWFAGRGSAKVGILPNSKFIGGRPVRVTSGGGGEGSGGSGGSQYRGRDFAFGDPDDPRYDGKPPAIEEVLIQEGSVKILAKITDTVGVKDAQVIVGKKAFPMSRHAGSQSWWYRSFAVDDLPSTGDTLSGKIVARDFNDNKAEHSFTLEVPFGALSAAAQGSSFVIAPSPAGAEHGDQGYSIIASSVSQHSQTISPQITIKNTGTEPMQNIRLMLSPELKGKFLLSDYAVKSIAPQSEYIVSLKLNGKPNVDAMNNPIPYSGKVMISVDNHTPYILQLSGEIPNESASLQSLFMKMISSKGEQRYKTFEKPDLRISQNAEYQVKLGSGEHVIKSTSDELIITNTGDKPLKNLRIMTSALADHFIPEQKNIDLLPAGSFIKVKLISKMDNAFSSRDINGELLVIPENGNPVTVPISIGKRLADDKNAMYEVNTMSGNNAISHTADGITIRNNSQEPIDSVRIVLPQQLARIFSITEDSFKSIEPGTEKTVYLELRGTMESNARQIFNDYNGDIIIVSSDGMKKITRVNIVWKGVSSEHFVVNARDNAEELAKATQVINFLERSYAETAKLIGETNTKTVIYMTSSLDEVSQLSDALAPSTYVYDEDVALVWSNSEDINILALKEFAYRSIMQNYGTYWSKQKITLDKGNWLVDGISNYVTSSVVGERGMIKEQLEAFVEEPASFEWYGPSTTSQHGASYTLFKFLAEKYGDTIIDIILNNLGSTAIGNKCNTLEQCALVKAVYDVNGFNINDKKHDLNFAAMVEEWSDYVEEEYSAKMN